MSLFQRKKQEKQVRPEIDWSLPENECYDDFLGRHGTWSNAYEKYLSDAMPAAEKAAFEEKWLSEKRVAIYLMSKLVERLEKLK